MKGFDFLKPQTVKEACSLLLEYGEEVKIIAGGQSLIPLMRHRIVSPRYLININTIPDLKYIYHEEKRGVRIGALTTHRMVEMSPVVRERLPVLSEAAHMIGDVQIRNMGTVGGSICHADPAADLAPTLIGLNARVNIVGPERERVIQLDGFYTDYFSNALEVGELLTEVQVSAMPPNTGGAYSKFSLRSGDLGVVGVTAIVTLNQELEECQTARIVLGSVGPTPVRAKKAEELMMGRKVESNMIRKVAIAASEESRPVSDIRGSEEYKRDLVRVLTEGTVTQAIKRAGGGLV